MKSSKHNLILVLILIWSADTCLAQDIERSTSVRLTATAADIKTSRYVERFDDALAALGLARGAYSASDTLDAEAIGDWSQRPETLPLRLYRSEFGWKFHLADFERTVALLKTAARYRLISSEVRASLARVQDNTSKFVSEYPRRMRIVDSLSVGRYRFPDVSSARMRRFMRARINGSYGAGLRVVSGGQPTDVPRLKLEYCGDNAVGPCIGEPQVVWVVRPTGVDKSVPATQIVYPIHDGDHTTGIVAIEAYSGRVAMYTDRRDDLRATWPGISLEEARDLVQKQTGETPTAAVYTNLLSQSPLLVAVLTRSSNVYFVDPSGYRL